MIGLTKTDGKTKYNFSNFTFPSKFASKIYNKDFTLQEAEDNQQKLNILSKKLNNNYNLVNKIKTKERNDTLKSEKNLFHIREEIIRAFKRVIFRYIDGYKVDEESDEELDKNKFFKGIENESKGINYALFEKHFSVIAPIVLVKTLFKTKDKIKNNDLVNVIKSGLYDLKDKIEKMSEDKKKMKNQIEKLDIVEKIKFNQSLLTKFNQEEA